MAIQLPPDHEPAGLPTTAYGANPATNHLASPGTLDLQPAGSAGAYRVGGPGLRDHARTRTRHALYVTNMGLPSATADGYAEPHDLTYLRQKRKRLKKCTCRRELTEGTDLQHIRCGALVCPTCGACLCGTMYDPDAWLFTSP